MTADSSKEVIRLQGLEVAIERTPRDAELVKFDQKEQNASLTRVAIGFLSLLGNCQKSFEDRRELSLHRMDSPFFSWVI